MAEAINEGAVMSVRGDESYVTLEGTLVDKREKAIQLEIDDVTAWVPRSCCHFSTDSAVDRMNLGDQGSFKIMEWVATDRGFI